MRRIEGQLPTGELELFPISFLLLSPWQDRVVSVLELPFTDPDTFWKLP